MKLVFNMNSQTTIGFTQQIKKAWLDFTVQSLLAGQTPSEVRKQLKVLLPNQQKAISILSKIWLNVPPPLQSFRQEGLALYQQITLEEQLAVHWGMTLLAYPFAAVLAENVGRLVRIQNTITPIQLQKRLAEKWGERELVTTSVRQLMHCWVEWGILTILGETVSYEAVVPKVITHPRLTAWLLESILLANQVQVGTLTTLVNYTPALFPFKLSTNYFIPNERLELFSQGVGEIKIAIK
jgi:hypothetical protein